MRPNPHPSPLTSRPALVVDIGTSWTKLALAGGWVEPGCVDRLATIRSDHARDHDGADTDDPVDSGDDEDGDAVATGAPVRREAAQRWESALVEALATRDLTLEDVEQIAVASVSPSATAALGALGDTRRGAPGVRFVSAETAPLGIDYHPRRRLGADRIADAVGALAQWGAPVVVVDVGTAVTCDVVSSTGRFLGGAIAPGPLTGQRALIDRAPHLGPVDPLPAAGADTPALGTSTACCLRVGLVRGAAGLVDGLVRGSLALVGPCTVVATGGLAPIVAAHSETITDVDLDLTLRGIHLSAGGSSRHEVPPWGGRGNGYRMRNSSPQARRCGTCCLGTRISRVSRQLGRRQGGRD